MARAYKVRVQGHLDRCWSTWFDGLAITHHTDGTTALAGVVLDQVALHGILAKVRDLGLTLISVTPIEPE
jgi:hypothetical protein